METSGTSFSEKLGPWQQKDIFFHEGPVQIERLMLSISPYGPESVRSQRLLIFIDGSETPSVNVPFAELAGFTHGRIQRMTHRYAECSGTAIILKWPFSAKKKMRMSILNETDNEVPFGGGIEYTEKWSGSYLSATFSVAKPEKGQNLTLSLPSGAELLHGLVIGVQPSDSYWCGEGNIYLDTATLARGLDIFSGTHLDVQEWFGTEQGSSVAIRPPQQTVGHDFIGSYRWFPEGRQIAKDSELIIEQIGKKITRTKKGIDVSRIYRSDQWSVLIIASHSTIPCQRLDNYRVSDVIQHISRRDYENIPDQEKIWRKMNNVKWAVND